MGDQPETFAHPIVRAALEVFRLNGALIAAGDALVAPLGLTSARWQVMGAIVEAGGTQPVSTLARNMGLVRQSVQRIVNELAAEGLLSFAPNPHHRRAKLVRLTDRGKSLFEEASVRWRPMADALLAEFSPQEVDQLARLLGNLRSALEAERTSTGSP